MSSPKPVAPKPLPAPKPSEVKAANVIETGKPIPEGAVTVAVATGEAARMVASRTFEIEDNVPLPTKRVGVKGESIYPFATIGIGQSFFVAATDAIPEPWKTLTSMASRMTRDLHPNKYITARQDKDGKPGVRIWRAADATEPLAPKRVTKRSNKAALEAEAIDGDTSVRTQPEPMFDTEETASDE